MTRYNVMLGGDIGVNGSPVKQQSICDRLNWMEEALTKLGVFNPMIEQYVNGVPVTKLCYGLNNEHMDVLRDIKWG